MSIIQSVYECTFNGKLYTAHDNVRFLSAEKIFKQICDYENYPVDTIKTVCIVNRGTGEEFHYLCQKFDRFYRANRLKDVKTHNNDPTNVSTNVPTNINTDTESNKLDNSSSVTDTDSSFILKL